MRRLIVMRHAKSSWDDPTLDDHARTLNKRGRASAAAMGDWMREHGFTPDKILSSSAQRTGETVIGLGLAAPVTYRNALYHAGPDVLLSHLQAETAPCVLMVGHNPVLALFAERLAATPPDHDRFSDFPTAATWVAEFDATDWREVCWGQGQTRAFAIPREVMAD